MGHVEATSSDDQTSEHLQGTPLGGGACFFPEILKIDPCAIDISKKNNHLPQKLILALYNDNQEKPSFTVLC